MARFPPLWCPHNGIPIFIIYHDSADKVFSNDRYDISIFNGSAYDSHKLVMVYCVKELFHVDVYNPVITVIHHIEVLLGLLVVHIYSV